MSEIAITAAGVAVVRSAEECVGYQVRSLSVW